MTDTPENRPPRLLPATATEKTCENRWCKKSFGAPSGHERFCSWQCQIAPKNAGGAMRHCKACGELFTKQGNRVTCCDECADLHKAAQIKANNERQRERARARAA